MRYSLLSLSLLTYSMSTSALHLPFIRRVAPISDTLPKLSSNVFAKSGSLGLINHQNNLYSSVITVNGKDVLVDLDTGSSDLYLYNYVDGLLDSARTYPTLNPSNLTINYGIGSVTGNVSLVDMTFAGFSVTNQSFLHVTQSDQTAIIDGKLAAGLLGLGFDTISNIHDLVQSKFPGTTEGRTLLSNIFSSNPPTSRHIAFRLDRLYDNNDTDTGSFDIGTFKTGFEAVKNTPEIPIYSVLPGYKIYWSVLVDGISINGKNQTLKSAITNGNIPPDGKLAASLDTGYSYPQVTREIAAAIYEPMDGVFDDAIGYYLVPCKAQTNLTFYIGGHTIPIHPLDLSSVGVASLDGQNVTVCRGYFQPISGKPAGGLVDIILGDAFLRNTYTVYNFGNLTDGTSGLSSQNPYIKLLPLTDPDAASAEFQAARKTQLATLPPEVGDDSPDSRSALSNKSERTAKEVTRIGSMSLAVSILCGITSFIF